MHGAGGTEATKQPRGGSSAHGCSRTCAAGGGDPEPLQLAGASARPRRSAPARPSRCGRGGAAAEGAAVGAWREGKPKYTAPRRGGAGCPPANPRPSFTLQANGRRGEPRDRSLAAA